MAVSELRLAPLIGLPGRVKDVECGPAKPDNPSNPKGARTYNHIFPLDLQGGLARRMLAWRVRGEEVGNHFHPRAPNKDPEMFAFLYGDVDVIFTDSYGESRLVEVRIQPGGAPFMCTIPPYILHRLVIISDHAAFEEFQEGPFDPAVNFTAAEFKLFCEEHGVYKD